VLDFPWQKSVRNLLLVSDSQAISPLLAQMERAVAAGLAVTLALGSNRAAAIYPTAALPPAVELQAATLDGSLGRRGPVTDLLPPLLRWPTRFARLAQRPYTAPCAARWKRFA